MDFLSNDTPAFVRVQDSALSAPSWKRIQADNGAGPPQAVDALFARLGNLVNPFLRWT